MEKVKKEKVMKVSSKMPSFLENSFDIKQHASSGINYLLPYYLEKP